MRRYYRAEVEVSLWDDRIDWQPSTVEVAQRLHDWLVGRKRTGITVIEIGVVQSTTTEEE